MAKDDSAFGALASGTQLLEYAVEHVLGHGGFGITYLAIDTNLHARVAIKEFLPSEFAARGADDKVVLKSADMAEAFDWAKEKFLAEARVLARFAHPNIVRVSRFFEANQTVYFVMDFIDGDTLADVIKTEAPISEQRLRDILVPVIDGLSAVHEEGILHRDIKAANIILGRDGVPVLIDFGAAKQAVGAATKSMFSMVSAGTAPIEQYSDDMEQGAWTDVYALGSVAYRLLTGSRPVDAIRRIHDDPLVPAREAAAGRASETFLRAIDWSLEVHPHNRPQSLADWHRALDGELTPPEPTPPTPRPRPATSDADDDDVVSLTKTEVISEPQLTETEVMDEPTVQTPPGHRVRGPRWAAVGAVVTGIVVGGVFFTIMRQHPQPADPARLPEQQAEQPRKPAARARPADAKMSRGLDEADRLAAEGDSAAIEAFLQRRMRGDADDAAAHLLRGHLAFAAQNRTGGAEHYGKALEREPSIAERPLVARNLVGGLGWDTRAVRPLIRAHPTAAILEELGRRTGEPGRHGRNRAYELLNEFGEAGYIDHAGYARLELAERESCEDKRPMVVLLGQHGEAGDIPLLEKQVDGWFTNRCMRDEVKAAVRQLRSAS